MTYDEAAPNGFTVVELIVVLAVLAIGLGIVTGAIVSSLSPTGEQDEWERRLEVGRQRAIREGTPIVVWHDSAHAVPPVLFLPDGRAVAFTSTPDAS